MATTRRHQVMGTCMYAQPDAALHHQSRIPRAGCMQHCLAMASAAHSTVASFIFACMIRSRAPNQAPRHGRRRGHEPSSPAPARAGFPLDASGRVHLKRTCYVGGTVQDTLGTEHAPNRHGDDMALSAVQGIVVHGKRHHPWLHGIQHDYPWARSTICAADHNYFPLF
jgi:hypothetical protein